MLFSYLVFSCSKVRYFRLSAKISSVVNALKILDAFPRGLYMSDSSTKAATEELTSIILEFLSEKLLSKDLKNRKSCFWGGVSFSF